jgi:hypothetical protein
MRPLAILALVFLLVSPLAAQAPPAGRGAPPPAPRESAAVDLTGYWVSVIVEDWKWRMVTPKKGVYEGVPLNAEGRKMGDSWDPARDEAAGQQCKAYGAANIMRLPGRLHITWNDANTLKIETDTGTQTRLFRFGGGSAPAAGQPSVQGYSLASWLQAPGRGRAGAGPRPGGSMKVITTGLTPGYVRKNGAPHSGSAVVTEYYDVNTLPSGEQWMTITTKVEDPQYFVRHYLTTSDFLKLPNASGWAPTPCSAR